MQLAPEKDVLISQIADHICQRGWHTSLLIILEAGRPLTFLIGQLLWVAQPTLSLIMPSQKIRQTAHLLEDPAAIKQLIACLEAHES